MNMTDVTVQRIIALGLQVLSVQVMTLLALLINAGIFCWAISTESYVRLAGAAVFAIASWCIVYLRPKRSDS